MVRLGLRLVALIALLGGVMAWPRPVLACTCGLRLSPREAFDAVDAVFVGTVTGITDLTWITQFDQLGAVSPELHPYMYRRAAVVVNEAWKGVTDTSVVVRTCGYPFNIGRQYVIYSYQGRNGLETDVCTRTKEAAVATTDLVYLRSLPSLPFKSPWPLPLLVCAGLAALLTVGLTSFGLWRKHLTTTPFVENKR